ncbi:hypothetical protein PIB30_073149 [Stylosanthes scabra]|uniref:Uncharacterized protein n=1 Tax=Stylosanthes scabra TaxID=79078 RepID=A0ABU6UNL9_9FABA|nr:hypothetical protein [Stylosanthes scabra]
MIGAGKNGPPGKYERWLSSASFGSVWRSFRTKNPWVGDSHSVYSSDFSGTGSSLESWQSIRGTLIILAFSEGQVFRCVIWRTSSDSDYELPTPRHCSWRLGVGGHPPRWALGTRRLCVDELLAQMVVDELGDARGISHAGRWSQMPRRWALMMAPLRLGSRDA